MFVKHHFTLSISSAMRVGHGYFNFVCLFPVQAAFGPVDHLPQIMWDTIPINFIALNWSSSSFRNYLDFLVVFYCFGFGFFYDINKLSLLPFFLKERDIDSLLAKHVFLLSGITCVHFCVLSLSYSITLRIGIIWDNWDFFPAQFSAFLGIFLFPGRNVLTFC